MRLLTLQARGVAHHWRAHAALLAGVAVAGAVLTGALLVGDSLRGSLRAAALRRLDGVTHAVRTARYFRTALAADLRGELPAGAALQPAILVHGSAHQPESGRFAPRVALLAISADLAPDTSSSWSVQLNRALAADLGVRPGDDVLLRLPRAATYAPETLLGRRDEPPLTLRLTVAQIRDDAGADFALQPGAAAPRNAFVPLATLQRALAVGDRVNTLLVRSTAPDTQHAALAKTLHEALARHATLADYGLRLRADSRGYIALESEAFLLSPPAESAGRAAAAALQWPALPLLAYLANSVRGVDPAAAVPYSTVVAADVSALAPERLGDLAPLAALASGELAVNSWTARELGASPGDRLELTYFVTVAPGELTTQTCTLRLRAVLPMTAAVADAGFAPEYPGITDATRLSDWDPPFPIDLQAIRPQDEVYWDEYRAAPKAFVTLEDGQRLWAEQPERFGRLTALRVYPPVDTSDAFFQLEAALRARLDPAEFGLTIAPVQRQALAASTGATDYAGLFLAFSLFLLASALLIIALLFRLGVERRVREIGLLLALGFRRRRITRLLLSEAALVALAGVLAGLSLALGMAALLLGGLRTIWAAAAPAPELQMHVEPASLATGGSLALLFALVTTAFALRGMLRVAPRRGLAGEVPAPRPPAGTAARGTFALTAAAGLGGAVLIALGIAKQVDSLAAFFLGGTLLLAAGIGAAAGALRQRPTTRVPDPAAVSTIPLLGWRNAARHPGRSVLVIALLACATFNLVAVQAARLKPPSDIGDRRSGTGGFALIAETATPIVQDLSTPAGRAALADTTVAAALDGVELYGFRLRAGEEISCLNLYRPQQPRILGAPAKFQERGGFDFAGVLPELAGGPAVPENPWRLLEQRLPDGAIPVITDEAAARWQLHVGLGETLSVQDERGRTARLRLVALLRGSILQGELVIAESEFLRLFPSSTGYSYFLAGPATIGSTVPADRAPHALSQADTVEALLAPFGVALTPTPQRLSELFAVQNTYLRTFQTLGGFGLLLGTLGLAVVLLRNVNERRGELALLRALGFSRVRVGVLVLSENALLSALGLVIGLLAALGGVAPAAAARGVPLPWESLLLMLGGILAAGVLAGAAACAVTLRVPLLPALRAE